MSKIFTTSYDDLACGLITALVQNVRPKTVIEIGCQQGRSTVALAAGMQAGSKLISVDLFEEKYDAPPYLETHASLEKALENLRASNPACEFEVRKQDGVLLADEIEGNVDVLHVDVCNHERNLYPILQSWHEKVSKLIILEGGIYNKWQQRYGFASYRAMLREKWLAAWDAVTIPFNDHNSITVMAKTPDSIGASK